MSLKLDHIIHYVKNIEHFNFPGDILKIHPGGKHEKLGTHNRLVYLKNAYVELLDIYKIEQLQKIVKSEEGRVSFPSKIVQDGFSQGFKTIAFETNDIENEKARLEQLGVNVIGPISMERENKKGKRKTWKLLYIAEFDYCVKPPFFIQWDEPQREREEALSPLRQNHFTLGSINIESKNRHKTVENWQKWYNMAICRDNEEFTELKLDDEVVYRIFDGDQSSYKSIVIEDDETTSSYSFNIRGAEYRFI
ncbi:VOC family protein [Staphylococcus sp. SQ8-PEA]|uniref:VOC family protein n=1 Tax=Staphylococcus marylandisciuri TaxID=2981529 RepID=A0ABT2QMG6_9STAP|nr:VOC family protein [Staphylococcus marylandisciuri]MCU5745172.1 VOC family protein [Staphylococcus marylandisciuri]